MAENDELIRLTACAAVALLRRREVTPLELVEASLTRIEAVDGPVNAMVTRCAERARDQARRIMASPAPSHDFGWLGGLPLAVKDLNDLAGVRTTYGSPIFADHVPVRSDIMVERLESHGGIPIGKSNTPEFGAGANTFNEVFGDTLNPWNTTLNAGGSSGGSAVALATGQVWLATGSDLGGSLRTPASFCSVVGLRPSPGRVASGPDGIKFDTLSVNGPMARTVEDIGLMLDAMAGWDIGDPLSLEAPAIGFRESARRRQAPKRIAFSPDLGVSPVNRETRALCEAAARRFEAAGCIVEEACPDFSGVPEAFQTLRALGYVAGMRELYETKRALLKPDVIWNIERGRALDAETIATALLRRSRLYDDIAAFFSRYDLLLAPAACTPPLDIKQRWVREVEGHVFENYVEWLRLASVVTMASCPSLAIPAGFTADGRPVGLQLVGRPRGEAALLSAGAVLEDLLGLSSLVPIEPRPGSADVLVRS
ncbi:amidase [Labrys miyagiensis]|uniref:Indoleacetamide hydrolase n=1 Tax=Labrys miyagiensis TaxID=346912 RepID=A0ABQ6CG79_9HYPH|nr:amidase family protein [Labrys miyagiensis]GLS17232.1 amidase [Labrys miyagiensis]